MLQQLQNLASHDITHVHQNCPLLSENRSLNGCNALFAESWVEECLELNFKHVDYQTLAQFLCLLDLCARVQQERNVS